MELSDNSESKICLLGDFNARSGKQQDIIFHDETMEQFLHSDNIGDRELIMSTYPRSQNLQVAPRLLSGNGGI